MTQLAWRDEPISKSHDRENFDCGEPHLNDYLRRHARKNHERGASKTFVALSRADERKIVGYYSLSPAALAFQRTPEIIRRGLARYDVPGFRLGRLAVERGMQGNGLGGQLLLSAARRCILASSEVGGIILLIDAKNEHVAGWYGRYGPIALADEPLSLVLPLAPIAMLLRSEGKL